MENANNLKMKSKNKNNLIAEKMKNGLKYRMALSILFCLHFLFGLHLSSMGNETKYMISLDFEVTPLSNILDQIEAQSTYHFVYSNDEVDVEQKFSIKVHEKSFQNTIDKLLRGSGITYTLREEIVILKNNPKAQNYTISGTISDAETGETLIGATIYSKEAAAGGATNAYGFYSVTFPEGTHTLAVSFVGYTVIENIIELNENTTLNIELAPSSNQLEEVVVMGNTINNSQVGKVLSGVTTLSNTDIKKVPAFMGEADITRVILTQPGVSTVGEAASGFNVRGGNIDQNLILLDEAPLFNSSHVWGLFSTFNADAVKEMKLYKGGIPARFGGKGSSVLDIKQKDGNSKEFKGEGGLGLLFSRLTLEGPIKKDKLSFIASGRRSYFDIFFPLAGDDFGEDRLYFYDLSTKLTWNVNEKNKLFFSGYFGADVMKIDFGPTVDENGREGEDSIIDFRWKNATSTVRWNHIFSNRLFMNTTAIFSNYNYSLFSKNDEGGGPADTEGSFTWKSSVKNYIFKSDFTLYSGANTIMRFGANNTLYKFIPSNVKSDEKGVNDLKLETQTAIEVAPYLELEKWWNKFEFNIGMRYSWFNNMGERSVSEYAPSLPKTSATKTGTKKYKKGETIKQYGGLEPRVSLKYNLREQTAIKAGYNKMYQYIHLISNGAAALPFDIWLPSGKYIRPLGVDQFSLGLAHDIPASSYNFYVDAFYKKFSNMVEYKNNADLFINRDIETQLLLANGYAYGLELSAHKNKGKVTGNANYTYSVTERKTTSKFNSENINGGSYYPSNYDRPHIFNMTANLAIGSKWELNTFFTFQTGRPTTLPVGKFLFRHISNHGGGEVIFDYSDRNKYRIPNTHRLDVSFTYTPDREGKKRKGSWNFGVYNVYGHKNAFSVFHGTSYSGDQLVTKAYQYSLLAIPIPFATYNFNF